MSFVPKVCVRLYLSVCMCTLKSLIRAGHKTTGFRRFNFVLELYNLQFGWAQPWFISSVDAVFALSFILLCPVSLSFAVCGSNLCTLHYLAKPWLVRVYFYDPASSFVSVWFVSSVKSQSHRVREKSVNWYHLLAFGLNWSCATKTDQCFIRHTMKSK